MSEGEMSDKLLPCPFCGGEALLERRGSRRKSCLVACTNCGVRHESADEDERSGESWNTRAALAQGAEERREPVAWLYTRPDGFETAHGDAEQYPADILASEGIAVTPLYAAPPAAAQGCGEERQEECRSCKGRGVFGFEPGLGPRTQSVCANCNGSGLAPPAAAQDAEERREPAFRRWSYECDNNGRWWLCDDGPDDAKLMLFGDFDSSQDYQMYLIPLVAFLNREPAAAQDAERMKRLESLLSEARGHLMGYSMSMLTHTRSRLIEAIDRALAAREPQEGKG